MLAATMSGLQTRGPTLASYRMPKKRLMTPGPTQVPEQALLAMARQVGHHRTPEFIQLFTEVLQGLKYVFQTCGDVVVLACSGTGAMEAAVMNTVPRGAKAVVLEAGVFAERWTHICRSFGIEVVRHQVEFGKAVDPEDVARLLQQHPDAVAVFATLMESSTGVVHDIQSIGRIVADAGPLFIVDAISGAGVVECRTDDWSIDMLVVGSQKALMLPPGLGFLAVSEKAWRQIEGIQPQGFYFDLRHYRKKLATGPETPWTPAHTMVTALAENLKLIRAEGIEHIWSRFAIIAEATRAGVRAMRLQLFAERPAAGMTSVRFSDGLDGSAFLKRLETRFGVKLASGQMHLKGKIFRIAHMGIIDELDILGTLAAMEMVLSELGAEVQLGAGVTAAMKVMASTAR